MSKVKQHPKVKHAKSGPAYKGSGKADSVANSLAPATVCELRLTFAGPLLPQQAGTLALGMDTAMQRYRGKLVLNGSLIRGNIRDYMGQLAEVLSEAENKSLQEAMVDWFGKKPAKGDTETNRGHIHFDLFWKFEGKAKKEQRTRIQINGQGSVESGALQVIEDCFPTGSEAVFKGEIRARFNSEEDEKQFKYWLEKTLNFIPAMGSLKGVGYGKLKAWTLKEPSELRIDPLVSKKELSPKTVRFGITLKLNQPFCIGKPRTPDSNRIESDNFIIVKCSKLY